MEKWIALALACWLPQWDFAEVAHMRHWWLGWYAEAAGATQDEPELELLGDDVVTAPALWASADYQAVLTLLRERAPWFKPLLVEFCEHDGPVEFTWPIPLVIEGERLAG